MGKRFLFDGWGDAALGSDTLQTVALAWPRREWRKSLLRGGWGNATLAWDTLYLWIDERRIQDSAAFSEVRHLDFPEEGVSTWRKQ
jgi:hypothetical protein